MSVIQILTLQTRETKDDGTRDAVFFQNGNDCRYLAVKLAALCFSTRMFFPCWQLCKDWSVCGRITVLCLVRGCAVALNALFSLWLQTVEGKMAPVAPEDDGWSRAGAAALCLSGTRLTYATGAVLTEGPSSTRPAPTLLFQSSHNVSQTGSCEPAMRLRWKHDIMGFLGLDITFLFSVIPSSLRHLKY